jgi:hypothetical protein
MKESTIYSRIYYNLTIRDILCISTSDLISGELNFSISIKLLIKNQPNNSLLEYSIMQ